MIKTFLLGPALLLAAPALAQMQPSPNPAGGGDMSAAGQAAATSGAPQVTVGATVSDTSGASVGTVSAVANGTATIDTGTAKAAVPVSSFGKGQSGLVIAMSKAQLEAAVAQSKPQIAAGNSVVGPQGNPVGTVTAVSGDLVTVQTAKTKVQLPAKAFAQKSPGTLVIGMTADQLDAAAKAAGAPSGG